MAILKPALVWAELFSVHLAGLRMGCIESCRIAISRICAMVAKQVADTDRGSKWFFITSTQMRQIRARTSLHKHQSESVSIPHTCERLRVLGNDGKVTADALPRSEWYHQPRVFCSDKRLHSRSPEGMPPAVYHHAPRNSHHKYP